MKNVYNMDIEKLKKAGQIAAKVREEVNSYCEEGKDFLSVINFCEERIIELEGEIAWVQISPTTTAAHFCPTKNNNPVCEKGDLLKIDIGVHIDGYIADTATTVLIPGGEDEELKLKLIETSKRALEEAGKLIKPGVTLRELGIAQMNEAKKSGFTTVTNLSGHTIDRWRVHGGLSIPTFDNSSTFELKEGDLVAIEPFITDGEGKIHEEGIASVFMQARDANVRSQQGRKILTYVRERNGLPFSTQELEQKFDHATTILGLRELKKNKIIQEYPPLTEISKRPVAQFEHTFIVGYGCITKLEE